MDTEFIVIPTTNQKVYDGSVVILQRLPNLKWILHHGYYTYNGTTASGWYLASIPDDTIMPFLQSDLYSLTVVDGPCPPGPCPPGPCPPGPCPPYPPGPGPDIFPYTRWDKDQVRKSMITVDTLAERDALSNIELQSGKVVRVNDYEGKVEYFQWNSTSSAWELLDWGERVALSADVAATYVTKEELAEKLQWKYLNTEE